MLTGHKSLRWAGARALFASLGWVTLGGSLASGARGSAFAGNAPANGVVWAVERGAYAALVVDDEVVVAPRGTSHPGGALRLRTLSARRGAGIADRPVVGVASAVGVTIHRGPIDERVESREEGIEQTWRFDVRPRGAGDLVVRVRVEGNRYAGKSAHGLAFVDNETRARMTYGDGTWVDAAGVRTEVPARFVDGAVELRVSSVLVEASAFPAILDPSVGPEFAMDAPVFNPVTSPDLYEDVEVGYGAGTYLVTWFDGSLPQPTQAVRVRASDGVVLDPSPIGLVAGKPLAIASDGTNFLLAWSGGAARLAIRDGALLDGPAGFATPTQSPAVSYVSSTGEYVEAWSAGTNVSRVAINAASATIGAPQAVAATGAGAVPTVAGASTGVLVAWADQRSGTSAWDIFGSLSSTPNFPIAHSLTAKSAPSAASNGTDYFVAWNALQLSGTRVRASDGAALDGTMGMPLSMAAASPARTSFDGVDYLVAYAANAAAAIQVVRVAPSTGSLLDGAPASGGITVATAPSGTSFLSPSIASSSTESLVAWVATNGAPVVMASRVRTGDGALLDGPGGLTIALSKQHTSPGTPNSETLPVVTTDGASYLVSWLDDRFSPAAVPSHGMLVRASDGALLDTSAFPLPIGPIGLAFDGTTFFASGKSASTHIRSTDGVELDLPNGIAAAGQSVACVAGTCLVVESRWLQQPSGSYPTVFVQRVRASDGALLDPPGGVQISQRALLNSDEGLVAAGSSSFLVAWREQQHSYVTLKYAIVDLLGRVTGPFQLAGPGMTLVCGSLASDGTNFLAEYSCSDCFPNALMATRIRESDGTLLDGVPGLGAIVVGPPPTITAPTTISSTAFDGKNFLTLYEGSSGLIGARVRPNDGALLDEDAGTGFAVTPSVGVNFALASAGQGRAMVVYSDGARVRARLIDDADGILDSGGAIADGAADPARDGGAGGQTTEGGMTRDVPDATSDGALLVADADADGVLRTVVDASVIADSAAIGPIDAPSASFEASSGMVPGDARADDAAGAGQSPASDMAGGGGGSGGCSMAPNPASNGGSSGGMLGMVVCGLALVRARGRLGSPRVRSV